MPDDRRRPTLAQVAAAAGVSTMTASYVYSRPSRVSPDAAGRVRAAAVRLGYPGPHPGARSLRRGKAGSLGVVIGEHLAYAFDDPQAAQFLAGVAEECGAAGVGLTLVPTVGSPSDVERVRDVAVDGFVVWTTTDDDPVLDAVAATGLPAAIHAGPPRPGLPVVGIDDRAAARAIGRVVFAGARRPAVLSFPIDRDRQRHLTSGPPSTEVTFPVTRARWRGYLDAWRDLGGSPQRLRVAVSSHNSAACGEELTRELLDTEPPPDALAAMSDELALAALGVARHAGLTIPADLAVSGWDDTDAAGRGDLTTLAQSLRHQGRLCAQLAVHPARPPTDPVESAWQVVIRGSTRPAVTSGTSTAGRRRRPETPKARTTRSRPDK